MDCLFVPVLCFIIVVLALVCWLLSERCRQLHEHNAKLARQVYAQDMSDLWTDPPEDISWD